MRYFFIKNPSDIFEIVAITGSDANHIINVLRYKSGDKIGLLDGTGFEYKALIKSVSKKTVELIITDKTLSKSESNINISIAQAYLKDKKMDEELRQLTELGIVKWIPFIAKRSIPNTDKEKIRSRIIRWEKIAVEAIKQTKRGKLPKIHPMVSFEEVLNISKENDLKFIFYENETRPIPILNASKNSKIKNIIIIIGPEGGLTSDEVNKAETIGFTIASLGPRLLKAPTAALAAAAIIQFVYGDVGGQI